MRSPVSDMAIRKSFTGSEQRFAILTPLEYTELLLTLSEPARRRILAQARRQRRELRDALPNPRSP